MTRQTTAEHWFIALLKRYGFAMVGVPIIIASIVIWGLAHFFSAPGTPVKVLWGLVEYTKKPNGGENQKVTIKPKSTPKGAIKLLQPTTIDVVHDVTASKEKDIIDVLHKKYELRGLSPIETSRGIGDTPPGSFFYIYAGFLKYRYEYPINANDKLMGGEVSRTYRAGSHFEIHHRKDEFLIIGFATVTDADKIRSLSGETDYKITITPKAWGSFTSLILIPLARIASSYPREIEAESEYIYVLDLTVR